MRKVNVYQDSFKREIVNEYLSSEISQEAIRKKYGIGGSMTITRWVRKFTQTNKSEMKKEQEEENVEVARLKAQLEVLRRELEYERLRREGYQTMIKIAEEEFDIKIEKKFGAKQSKK